MISENDVVAITKEYIGDLLAKSENQDEQTFMSFPKENFHINSILFSAPDMSVPAKRTNYMKEYALLCGLLNCIPNDEEQLNSAALAESLHTNYKFILDNCVLQNTFLSEREQEELQAASTYLYSKDNILSEKYRRYIEFKEEIYSLNDQLIADQLTASDLSEQERIDWQQTGKKLLQDRIKFVEQKLLIDGQKAQVEKHIQNYQKLQNKHPSVVVENLKERINEHEKNDISLMGTSDSTYLPVQPSPQLHSIEIWQNATITGKEIHRLQKKLLSKTGNFNINRDLKQIDFEWCSVYISRDWFDSAFFKSNYWNMPNDAVVSRGERPNSGVLPTYIKRLVVSKSVRYKTMVTKTKPRPKPTRPIKRRLSVKAKPQLRHQMLRHQLKSHGKAISINNKAKRAQQRNISLAKASIKTPMFTAALRPNTKVTLDKKKTAKPAHIKTALIMPTVQPLMSKNLVHHQLIARKQNTKAFSDINTLAMNKLVSKNMRMAIPQKNLNLKHYLANRSFVTKAINIAAPANKQLVQKKIGMSNPLILSFICKRVPSCPNPKLQST